jgi:SAM-dependent methyltransferase
MGAWLRMDAVKRALARSRPLTIVEVGAGVGAMAARLAAEFDYTGLEPDETSFAQLQRALGHAGRGRAIRGGIELAPAGPCDLLCAFEVLEHIADDEAELLRWRAHIKPGGFLLLSVPAHPALFGPLDSLVGHLRRYERKPLEALLARSGFEIVQFTSVGAGLGHLSQWIGSRLARTGRSLPPDPANASRHSGRLWRPSGRASAVFRYLVAVPFRLLQRLVAGTDIGTGYVVLARRHR